MREDVGYTVKGISDREHSEMSPQDVLDIFTETYVNIDAPIKLIDCNFVRTPMINLTMTVEADGKRREVMSTGNGRLDAVSNAFKRNLGLSYSNLTYTEHALESESTSKAVTYVGITDDNGKTHWGAGVHEDIITSSIHALVSAINKKLA